MAQRGKRNADEKLLLALACGATPDDAAHQAGVSPRTVYRRLAEPEFQRRLQVVRADMVQRTAGALAAAGNEAVGTLVELMKPASPAATRLGAARSVLEIGMKVREVADLEQRLTALEAQMGANSNGTEAAMGARMGDPR
jgi:hypothetical protein